MINQKVAAPYTKALLSLIEAPEKQEQMLIELEDVINLIDRIPQWQRFLHSPQLTKYNKQEVLRKHLEGKIDKRLLVFLLFLIDKGRFKDLPEIAKQFRKKVAANLRMLEVDLATAVPLDAKTQKSIIHKLEAFYQKSIKVNTIIDPKILGGVMIIHNDRMIDYSIKNRLAQLRKTLLLVNV
jgi:F-type H+-transporting ATPase subunit delta